MGRLVEILNDVTVETKCNTRWFVTSRKRSPLESLAQAADEEEPGFGTVEEQWLFECQMHQVTFPMGTSCPHAYESFAAGESVVVEDVTVAERLVRSGQAAYPTHKPKLEESVQATLDRTNMLMDQMGFPHMDAEAMQAMNAVTQPSRGTSRHYAKPTDTRLAGELGLSPSDVAEMRKLSKG